MTRNIYQGHFLDQAGNAVDSGTVTCYLAGTSTLANIYAAKSGGAAISGSTVTTDSTGYFKFYVQEEDFTTKQLFDIVLSKTGFLSKTYLDVVIEAPSILSHPSIVSLEDYTDLATALTSIGSINATTIIIPSSSTVSANTTVTANITLMFLGAGILTINAGITLTINGSIVDTFKQIFSGTGTVTTTNSLIDFVRPEWWGAKADSTTDDYTAINNAITSGRKYVKFRKATYAYGTTITIADLTTGLTLDGSDYGGWTELRYTPATGNGFTFTQEADNFVMKNIYINSNNSSTGWAFSSQSPGANPLRDTYLENVSWTGFKNGFRCEAGLNISIKGGRQTGQGKGVAGGVGFLLGLNGAIAINHMIIEDIYVASYETDIHNASCGALNIVSSIIGTSVTGLLIDAGKIVIANNIYFDSNNDTAINNSGYLVYGANFSSLGTQTVTSPNHRLFRTAHPLTRISAYRGGDQNIPSGVSTKVQLNAETYDDENYFNSTSTYRFVANYPGFYNTQALMRWQKGTAKGHIYRSQIAVNGSVKKEAYYYDNSSIVTIFSIAVGGIFWLNPADYIELFAQHDEGTTALVKGGAIATSMDIWG